MRDHVIMSSHQFQYSANFTLSLPVIFPISGISIAPFCFKMAHFIS